MPTFQSHNRSFEFNVTMFYSPNGAYNIYYIEYACVKFKWNACIWGYVCFVKSSQIDYSISSKNVVIALDKYVNNILFLSMIHDIWLKWLLFHINTVNIMTQWNRNSRNFNDECNFSFWVWYVDSFRFTIEFFELFLIQTFQMRLFIYSAAISNNLFFTYSIGISQFFCQH